jgi:hypothetical protein
MIRTYEPGQRVKARLEISAGRFMRRTDAGLDVMGDGRLVAYAGGVRRRELEQGESPYDAIGDALR